MYLHKHYSVIPITSSLCIVKLCGPPNAVFWHDTITSPSGRNVFDIWWELTPQNFRLDCFWDLVRTGITNFLAELFLKFGETGAPQNFLGIFGETMVVIATTRIVVWHVTQLDRVRTWIKGGAIYFPRSPKANEDVRLVPWWIWRKTRHAFHAIPRRLLMGWARFWS